MTLRVIQSSQIRDAFHGNHPDLIQRQLAAQLMTTMPGVLNLQRFDKVGVLRPRLTGRTAELNR